VASFVKRSNGKWA
jgi:hypothetical protein